MGNSVSDPIVFDTFDDTSPSRSQLKKNKCTSPSTSSSSLASTASMIEATGNIIMGTNAPLLYEYALVGDWASLIRRISSHPKEACYKDKCKNMPLHVACRRQPPPEVVEALIQANPDALVSQTLDGLTPLHFSCFCGSAAETIQLVLGCETSLREMIDRRGRTPLHCVCAGFRSPHRLQVVKMLLELDASCATAVDERGRTPLSLIVDDYVEELHEALQSSISRDQALQSTLVGGDLYDCWQVAMVLIRAAYDGTLEDWRTSSNEVHVGGKFQFLHAAVGISGCPAALIRLILKIKPNCIQEKDGDMNLPIHVACKTIGQPWARKVVTSKRSGVQVYNADFGHPLQSNDDLTVELIRAYPDAVKIPDESGKVPFVLAVESGKPWETSLRPLWEQHPLDDEQFVLLEKSLHSTLTSMSSTIRDETIKTMRHLVALWPMPTVDCLVTKMIDQCHELGKCEDSNESWNAAIHTSYLEALATTLRHVDKFSLELRYTPQQAFEMSLPLLSNPHESVRTSAARVIGPALAIMGIEMTEIAMREIIFPIVGDQDADDRSVSTIRSMSSTRSISSSVHSVPAMSIDPTKQEEEWSIHGRAMACHCILESDSLRLLTDQQRLSLKQWMRHESKLVRKGACWAVGSSLQTMSDIKEFRSVILKCMRPTEDCSVQIALANSLTEAAKKHDRMFLSKDGLPLLDSALMLSMSRGTSPLARQAFDSFLWHALQQQESGLQKYMDMAQGENGRIMMSLVTKKLTRMPVVQEGNEDKAYW
jgi:hypothetical protein